MKTLISQKGWVLIPAKLRKKYDLHPGTQVVIADDEGVLTIVPILKKAVGQGVGLLKKISSMD